MRSVVLMSALALMSCAEGADSGEAPLDYEAINDAAVGPPQPIAPGTFTSGDIDAHDLYGSGCNVSGQDGNIIFIARADAGYLRLDDEIMTFAPHPAESGLPFGVADHYDGREQSIDLQVDLASESSPNSASPSTQWAFLKDVKLYFGTLIIRDTKEREIFRYYGKVTCGA